PRSGASTVADASIVGRPAIWVPLAVAIRNEQEANACELVNAGAAVMMKEDVFEVDALSAEIAKILGDTDAALQMSRAALACAVPDATNRLETLVETLANGPQA
ncbi:MAG: glycosyltransferase, partial [Yoonia sp.]|uniref:glycosyltransferase n=1 Tax=Yoonia sp. TaxID=2212373 RepID=UPI003298D8F0